MDLNILGIEFLRNNPEEALELINKMHKDEIDKLNKNTIKRVEEVKLYEECLGQGDMFTDIDIVYLTADDSDSHTFWQLYIMDKEVPYEQLSGSGCSISDSTFVGMYNYKINGKKVMFVYPTSTWINWDSLEKFSTDLAKQLKAKLIKQKFYDLKHELNLK